MTDIRLKEHLSLEVCTMDFLLLDNGALDERESLATAVRVALGTDRLSDEGEVLPDPDSTDRRGWWGDFEADVIWGGWPVGCKNWLLTRAKITDVPSMEGSTIERARRYTLDALQPFIDQHIASEVVVDAIRTDTQRIDVTATIYRGPLQEINLRYQLLWQEEPAFDAPKTVPVINKRIRIPYRNLTLTTFVPGVSKLIQIPYGALSLTKSKPVLTTDKPIAPSRKALTLTTFAPIRS